MIHIRDLDLRSCAVISMLALWASTTFSIALMEISFVCALIFWAGWNIQLKMGILPQKMGGRADAPKIGWALWTPLVFFVMAVLVSFFASEYPKQSFRGLFKIAKPLLAFILAADLFRNERDSKRFDLAFVITFLIVTIDCSIQYAFGKDILRGFAAEDSNAGIRLVGPFGNFAKMAAYLVLVIPVFGLSFWRDLVQKDQYKRSFFALALALAGFTLLYLTRCRGPVVALVLSFLILFIYKRWFKALGLAVILCLALLSAVPHNVLIHLDAEKKEQSIVERFELWKRALDVIEAKPWTGTGINTYNVAHEKYDKEQNWRVRGYYAHNGDLQLTAEIGIPGIFFFLLFFFFLFKRALQAARRVRGSPEEYGLLGLLTGLLAFLIYAAADNNLQSPPSLMMFWYLTGVMLARRQSILQ